MKSKRQMLIKDLVQSEEIETQGELTQRLAELGVVVTQATISRDIKELGLIKLPTYDGRYKYGLPGETPVGDTLKRAQRIFKEFVHSIQRSFNLIIVKSGPGSANTVAAAIDGLSWVEIVGTVAGDDSTLILLADGREPGEESVDLKRMEKIAVYVEEKLNKLRG